MRPVTSKLLRTVERVMLLAGKDVATVVEQSSVKVRFPDKSSRSVKVTFQGTLVEAALDTHWFSKPGIYSGNLLYAQHIKYTYPEHGWKQVDKWTVQDAIEHVKYQDWEQISVELHHGVPDKNKGFIGTATSDNSVYKAVTFTCSMYGHGYKFTLWHELDEDEKKLEVK